MNSAQYHTFTRRQFLRRSAAGFASAATLGLAQSSRPNIVMILCDDLGYSDLGCYGSRVIRTPNLDRLAAEGTRFTDFYSVSPVCSPSRAGLITGRYPQRWGVDYADLPEMRPRYPLPENAVTLAQVLQESGYYTAHIGKWHLGEPPESPAPRKRGFDYFYGCFGGRPSSPWNKYARSMDPEMIENESRPKVVKGHVTDVETDTALRVLGNVRQDQPFFLNLWYNAPHEPLAPLSYQAEGYRHWSSAEQTYFQTVTDVDRAVARVREKLKEIGAARNTLIFFSSDNGPEVHSSRYARGSAWPLKGMKTQLWEGGIREPGILVWPGKVPAGKTSAVVSSTLDLLPTFCHAAQAAIPDSLRPDSEVDLVQVANGDLRGTDRPIFFEFHFPQRGVAGSLPMAVRHGEWKLFSDHEFRRFELYNLRTDIGEQSDVSGQQPELVARLAGELKKWWSDAGRGEDVKPVVTRVDPPTPEELEKRYYRN